MAWTRRFAAVFCWDRSLGGQSENHPNVAALKGTDQYRLRVGDWRVVYSLHDDVLMVLVIRVGHRREIYR